MVKRHVQLARWYITHVIGSYINNIYVFDNSSCTSVWYINSGKKSCLFGKVTYVTALIWTYIPYMIYQSYHHTPRTYIDNKLNVLIEQK